MCLNPRYDEDPPYYDDEGFMWSDFLEDRYDELNRLDERTKEQDAEIDMIYGAARRGRAALAEAERTLKAADAEGKRGRAAG